MINKKLLNSFFSGKSQLFCLDVYRTHLNSSIYMAQGKAGKVKSQYGQSRKNELCPELRTLIASGEQVEYLYDQIELLAEM
jgi:hypothetical protein